MNTSRVSAHYHHLTPLSAVLYVFVTLGATAMVCPAAFGDDNPSTRETLRGLQGIYVVISDIDPDAERAGLTKRQLQTAVELQLRKAGVRVLTREEVATTQGYPMLFVNLSMLAPKADRSRLYVYSLSVGLRQNTYLARELTILTLAETWSVGGLGIAGQERMPSVRGTVINHVDQFINAYFAVNPEQASRVESHQSSSQPSRGSHIRQAQERLVERGFDPGPIDGQPGAKTQAAIRQFQRAYGLPITGELDEATRKALGVE